jgi:Tol biopolymer transport system component
VSIARPGFVEPRALTNHKQGMVRQIFWSPTGKQIAFTFFTGGEKAHMELRLVPTKAGGKEVKLVTLKAGVEFGSINWSRSGKHLVYTAVKGNTSQIYRVTVQNKKVQKLSRSSKNIDADPVWSPDGKKIVFVSSRQPSKGPAEPRIPQLWVMKADGSGAKALVPDNSQENTNWEVFKPTWSPDGKKIVFIWLPQMDLHASANVQLASLDTNAGGLWVVDAKGGPATPLAACGTIPTEAPVWSPDGKKIAMACGDQSQTLLVANLEDGSLAQSKAALGTNHSLSWSPDSTTILYIKKMDENRRAVQLFLPDGEVSLAVGDPVEADSVVWSPVDKLP